MKKLIKSASSILVTVFILIAHISIRKFSPFPFNHLNIIFLITISLIIFTNDSTILLKLLIPAFLVELFSATPFGLNTAALLLSLSILSWFLINIFTNYSIYIVGLSGFVGIICYRLFFLLFLFGAHIFFNFYFSLTSETILEWLWEICTTTFFMIIFYLIISSFTNHLKPHYISIKNIPN